MRSFLPLLTVLFLLELTGCKPVEKVDASQFNTANWEEAIKSPTLTEAEFTRLYAQAAAAELKNAEVRITGKRELAIKLADGGNLKVFLDNAWSDAQNNPANRPEIVHRYLKALVASRLGDGADSALPDTNSIVAVIRNDSFLEQFAKFGGKTTNRLVFEPFVADIKIIYATDREGAIQYLTERDRQKLNLALPALRSLATANLQRLLPELNRHGDGPLYMLVADGNYESSLLLADNIWEGQASSVSGDIVAAVPSRDVLLFTGSASVEGIRQLKESVEKLYSSSSHLISKTLLVRRNGKWEKFKE
jgi:uncharacterized protein YtpQ (UPF0354 family)